MNILMTGAFPNAKEAFHEIEQLGHQIIFMQYEMDPLPCDPAWVEGIIGNGIFLSHDIEKFTHLHFIQLTSAGFDRVPMRAMVEAVD